MTKSKIVKFLEFFSIVGFGLAYWKFDLQIATMTLMVLMTIFIMTAKLTREPLNKLQIGTWLVVLGLGALTLSLQNDLFIKWKTTVINSILALIFGGSHLIGEKTIAERLLASRIQAPSKMLRNLNFAAVCYFITIGLLNIFIAYQFTTTTWVNFKLFGSLLLNIIFVGGCLFYLKDYLKDLVEK